MIAAKIGFRSCVPATVGAATGLGGNQAESKLLSPGVTNLEPLKWLLIYILATPLAPCRKAPLRAQR